MNKVAAPCCGSCRFWNDRFWFCAEHNEYAEVSQFCCEGEDYSPRNPIPITDLPGMSERAHAYKAIVEAYKTDRPAPEWAIKVLEAKDE